MENIEAILSLIGTALGLLVTALTFMLKFIKNAKARKAAEHLLAIGNAVLPYIKQAEQFAGYTGAEKKEYVMTQASQFASAKGIEFDEMAVSAKIDELVALAKVVNIKG